MKPCRLLIPVCLLAALPAIRGASLYSEGFDSEATAKVKVQKQSDTAISYVDYSSFVRQAPGGGGPLTVSIPEAPNRIPGSQSTRGVVLSALYVTSQRAINLLAADAPGGNGVTFSGNYRMAFDMWLSLDPTATASSAGTTEAGLWAVGTNGSVVLSRATRTTGNGTWGWLSTEGGAGTAAGAGDAVLWVDGAQALLLENLADVPLFSRTFPQGSPLPNVANNQWTAVEAQVIGTRVIVKMNGVKFFDQDPGTISGFAALGYDDIFVPSITFSRNWQFGLFDNFVVESLTDAPVLEVEPSTGFAPAANPGEAPTAEFGATNTGLTARSILSATIDGTHASQFSLATSLPMVLGASEVKSLTVTFTPSPPNGLKVARLVLTTNDPNAPTIALPLQAKRSIFTVEASLTTAIPTVLTQGGTSAGQITVTNMSLSPVNITSATSAGANPTDFSVTTALPLTIASGDSASLNVAFAPTGARGVRTASITLATTDPGSPTLNIPVRGRYSFGPPLLAHYKMDDSAGTTLLDSSGNNVNAGLQVREAPFGFSNPSLLPGGGGTSCRFTPADSVTSGNFSIAPVVHLPTVSYSLWIKPETEAGNRTILHRSSLFTLTGTLHSLVLTETGSLRFAVNSVVSVETADGAIADDQIYHVVVTHSDTDGFENTTADRTRLYIDGVRVAEQLAPDAQGHTDYQPNSAAEGLYIATATSAGAGYRGLIDDLQVYSIELTSAQVSGMHAQPGKTAFELGAAPFAITDVQFNRGLGTVTLTWSSQDGAVYTISDSADLAQWSPLTAHTAILATGATTTRTITGIPATTLERFYRVGIIAVP